MEKPLKQILTIIVTGVCFAFSVNAQTNDSWLNFLKSVRKEFYLNDTIVFSYKETKRNEYSQYLKPVKEEDCSRFFNLKNGLDFCGSHNEKYFYSYHLSKSNFATLTFFSFGKYAPTLTLYNYSPTGELIKRVEVKSSFMDEGLADSTNTYFKNDSTFVVRRWDGYEETDNCKSVLVDSITKTNYIIKSTGRIVKGTHSNERRTQ